MTVAACGAAAGRRFAAQTRRPLVVVRESAGTVLGSVCALMVSWRDRQHTPSLTVNGSNTQLDPVGHTRASGSVPLTESNRVAGTYGARSQRIGRPSSASVVPSAAPKPFANMRLMLNGAHTLWYSFRPAIGGGSSVLRRDHRLAWCWTAERIGAIGGGIVPPLSAELLVAARARAFATVLISAVNLANTSCGRTRWF
jgi:hypothetical protein